jgi:hypothetical protein
LFGCMKPTGGFDDARDNGAAAVPLLSDEASKRSPQLGLGRDKGLGYHPTRTFIDVDGEFHEVKEERYSSAISRITKCGIVLLSHRTSSYIAACFISVDISLFFIIRKEEKKMMKESHKSDPHTPRRATFFSHPTRNRPSPSHLRSQSDRNRPAAAAADQSSYCSLSCASSTCSSSCTSQQSSP